MQYDLIMIKEKYGEKMSHLCRTLFPTLLETEGLLYNLLESKFAHSRFLYNDLVENNLENRFKNYIYSLLATNEKKIIVDKTPTELLDEAGYMLYECKTEKDVEKFKKYYDKNEILCTFDDIEGRLDDYYVFFAIKKNVDEIKRKDFPNPQRQDEYGTSVISIQFTKGPTNIVSIKNRYNHTVVNPDATFSNNLDNIIEGLIESFEQTYNLNINGYEERNFEMPGYVRTVNGKYYKYNYEINNRYYGPNNIIVKDFNVDDTYSDKGRYLVFDYFILDMQEKYITKYDYVINDSFIDGLTDIEKVQIKKENNLKHICLKIKGHDVIITINDKNQIIAYQNNYITEIKNRFLYYNETLKAIYLENVKVIGDEFLACNNSLIEISLESVIVVGNFFAERNKTIKIINMPNVKIIERNFILCNEIIDEVNMPLLEKVDVNFLCHNNKMKILILASLKTFGRCFMRHNRCLETFIAPKLEKISTHYLEGNKVLSNVDVSEDIRNKFIYNGRFKDNFKQKQKKIGTR